jgi:hypothetical protein
MSRTRWNVIVALLLTANLQMWGLALGPAWGHPIDQEPPPAVPEAVLTTTDEEWEAMEVAGTNPDDGSFVVVPCKHIPPAGGPQQLDKVGCAALKSGPPGKDGKDGEEGKGGGLAMTSTLIVTKWRVKGHMHRGRGRP